MKTASEPIRHAQATVNIQVRAGAISALVLTIAARRRGTLIRLREVVAAVRASTVIRAVAAVRVAVAIAEAVGRVVDVQAVAVRDNTRVWIVCIEDM